MTIEERQKAAEEIWPTVQFAKAVAEAIDDDLAEFVKDGTTLSLVLQIQAIRELKGIRQEVENMCLDEK